MVKVKNKVFISLAARALDMVWARARTREVPCHNIKLIFFPSNVPLTHQPYILV